MEAATHLQWTARLEDQVRSSEAGQNLRKLVFWGDVAQFDAHAPAPHAGPTSMLIPTIHRGGADSVPQYKQLFTPDAGMQDYLSAEHLATCWNRSFSASPTGPLEAPLSRLEAQILIQSCKSSSYLLENGNRTPGADTLLTVGTSTVRAELFVNKILKGEAQEMSQLEVRPRPRLFTTPPCPTQALLIVCSPCAAYSYSDTSCASQHSQQPSHIASSCRCQQHSLLTLLRLRCTSSCALIPADAEYVQLPQSRPSSKQRRFRLHEVSNTMAVPPSTTNSTETFADAHLLYSLHRVPEQTQ